VARTVHQIDEAGIIAAARTIGNREPGLVDAVLESRKTDPRVKRALLGLIERHGRPRRAK
jgi:hypothetical protein